MIIDVTGIELTPGNNGKDCMDNGYHFYENGEPVECCCDECNYMMCCFEMDGLSECENCEDDLCPRNLTKSATSPFC